uniref:Beta-defensin 1 n=1 Tax=Rousettus aegyptiacus TaxID=9407 RepID=A0A7J8DWH5_ROUAE|nr:defensin beta 1 [Rousettus aegyptiacus]
MRVLHCLLLLCLLSAQMPTGAGLLASLIPRYPEYTCIKKGGTCNYSPCPRGTKVDGRCYRNKAKCCV